MKKSNKIIIFSACVVAVLAIVSAFCFIFISTDDVSASPAHISVQEVEGELCLVTDHSDEWTYCFQVEQEIDGAYLVIQNINSDVNVLKLSDCQVNFVAGKNYRFCACYANGNVRGEFSEKIEWTATWQLDEPENVSQGDGIITWGKVLNAEKYFVVCVDGQAQKEEFETEATSFDLSNLSAGSHTIYIKATSTNEFLSDSEFAQISVAIE